MCVRHWRDSPPSPVSPLASLERPSVQPAPAAPYSQPAHVLALQHTDCPSQSLFKTRNKREMRAKFEMFESMVGATLGTCFTKVALDGHRF